MSGFTDSLDLRVAVPGPSPGSGSETRGPAPWNLWLGADSWLLPAGRMWNVGLWSNRHFPR